MEPDDKVLPAAGPGFALTLPAPPPAVQPEAPPGAGAARLGSLMEPVGEQCHVITGLCQLLARALTRSRGGQAALRSTGDGTRRGAPLRRHRRIYAAVPPPPPPPTRARSIGLSSPPSPSSAGAGLNGLGGLSASPAAVAVAPAAAAAAPVAAPAADADAGGDGGGVSAERQHALLQQYQQWVTAQQSSAAAAPPPPSAAPPPAPGAAQAAQQAQVSAMLAQALLSYGQAPGGADGGAAAAAAAHAAAQQAQRLQQAQQLAYYQQLYAAQQAQQAQAAAAAAQLAPRTFHSGYQPHAGAPPAKRQALEGGGGSGQMTLQQAQMLATLQYRQLAASGALAGYNQAQTTAVFHSLVQRITQPRGAAAAAAAAYAAQQAAQRGGMRVAVDRRNKAAHLAGFHGVETTEQDHADEVVRRCEEVSKALRARLGRAAGGAADRFGATGDEDDGEGGFVQVTQRQLVEACGETAKFLKPYQIVGVNFLFLLHRSRIGGGKRALFVFFIFTRLVHFYLFIHRLSLTLRPPPPLPSLPSSLRSDPRGRDGPRQDRAADLVPRRGQGARRRPRAAPRRRARLAS
jgi:hypothetical protein